MAHLESNRRAGATDLAPAGLSRAFPLPRPRVTTWVPLAVLVLALGAWEWAVRTGVLSALHFPAPSLIADTVITLAARGILADHVGATLARMVAGVLTGGLTGLILGLLMGWSRPTRIVVDPFVAALHPLPKIAVLPLIMVVFGIGNISLVIVIATAAFFPLLINTVAGIDQINPIYFDVAHDYKARRLKIFRRVVVPGAAPAIIAGVRLAVNTSLLLTVAVEMVSARDGLGAMIWLAWITLRTEEIYAALFVIIVFGLLVNVLLNLFTRVAVPWQQERTRPGPRAKAAS